MTHDELIGQMIEAAIAAAEVINAVYARPVIAVAKPDGSPVTEADGLAEKLILDHLRPTGIPVLAEESASAGFVPELGERFFVVDPLDGTKEFLKRNGEFTVNIALVEGGRPTLGVVLVPVSGETFVGSPKGAFAFTLNNTAQTNRRPLHVDHAAPIKVVASRSHGHAALASLCASMDVAGDVSVGSSLKFCLLAQGNARLYPRFTPTCEWDTAAGQAVLEAAGGVVLDMKGEPLRYGKASANYLNGFFVAASSLDLAQKAALLMRELAV
jgi:3'(2'), 5'-bisphosphate nucleotidase